MLNYGLQSPSNANNQAYTLSRSLKGSTSSKYYSQEKKNAENLEFS